MKAIRLTATGQPLEMQPAEVGEVGSDDVLVRVCAAGICHSDAHYRAGVSPAGPLPITLGHEVAGVVEEVGVGVSDLARGDRVCLHYLITCGTCAYCNSDCGRFCKQGKMLGKNRDGGYAEYIRVPGRNAIKLADDVPLEHAAVMMCSSATALHALQQGRLKTGESVAIFGVGGLGLSAVQFAQILGADTVYGIDINPSRLKLAERLGAVPIDAGRVDPLRRLNELTKGRGVDVSLELVGLLQTTGQAIASVGNSGRVVLVGLTDKHVEFAPYAELMTKEAEIIGASDHTVQELGQLLEWYGQGKLQLGDCVDCVRLDAAEVNAVLDRLDRFGDGVRTVVTP